MAYGVVCQLCGAEAPSKQITLHQNIGALVIRYHKTTRGKLCKNCIHSEFWKKTSTTLGIGWLGTISVIIAPIFVINNVAQYIGTITMPKVPEGACKPVVDDAVAAKLTPFSDEILNRLGQKQDLSAIANDIGPKAGVTPGQAHQYALLLIRSRQQRQQMARPLGTPKAGFPVVMPQPAPQQQMATLPVEPVPVELVADAGEVQPQIGL